MWRFLKRIYKAAAILILLLIILLGGVFLKIRSEINKMNPLNTRHITEGIYGIKDEMVNVYLVKSKKGYIMIDAGNDLKAIKQGLDELNINKNKELRAFIYTNKTLRT